MSRALIVTGVIFVILGLVLPLLPSIPILGKLPGDIRIESGGTRIYIPLTTCLLLSLVVSGLLWLMGRIR